MRGKYVNLSDLIYMVSTSTKVKNDVTKATIYCFLKSIDEVLKQDGRVRIKGFGSFEKRVRKGKRYKNPRTKEESILPDVSYPYFNPSAKFKKSINN